MNKSDVLSLLPRDKFDLGAVDKISKLEEKSFSLILPEILTWISDINWPVAMPIMHIIAKFPNISLPYIKDALKAEQEDDDLKYYIILYLLPMLDKEIIKYINSDVERIYVNPTKEEYKGSFEAAKRYLGK